MALDSADRRGRGRAVVGSVVAAPAALAIVVFAGLLMIAVADRAVAHPQVVGAERIPHDGLRYVASPGSADALRPPVLVARGGGIRNRMPHE